ncbi:MAG: DUF3124 domain-containing protein [Magnetococcus sp. DMHC-1]|nr:DUF3124 domain-containing protein [Magnetococcales bacterium]
MKYARFIWIAVFHVVLLISFPVAASENITPPLLKNQAVYAPVYSHVLHGNLGRDGKPEEMLLSSMLSVRNTDPSYGMTIIKVDYYDTHGQIIRRYITKPVTIPAMGSTDFFVENRDRSGGTGANFVVEWEAAQPINQPIVESVQVYFWGTQAQAFVSRGQPIHLHVKPEVQPAK